MRNCSLVRDCIVVWAHRVYRCIDLFTDVTTFNSRTISRISSRYTNGRVGAPCTFSSELKSRNYDIFSDFTRDFLCLSSVLLLCHRRARCRDIGAQERSLWSRISTPKRDIENESRLTCIIRAAASELIGHANTNNEVITADNGVWWFNNVLNYLAVI